jgi:hypothetical protein
LIQSIFLRATKIVEWDPGITTLVSDWPGDFERMINNLAPGRHLGQYKEKTPLPAGSEELSGLAAKDANNFPKPPKVASIGTCDSNGCKESREGRINVNGIDAGIVQGSDGQKTANVSFYAWADSEQMPLRRIIVDWGDATSDRNDAGRTSWLTTNQPGSASDDNFYKNRRGLNADGKKICGNPDNKTFGFSSQACEDGYANFTHDYVCSQTMQTNLPNCSIDQTTGQLRNSPCKGGVPDAGDKCVFQPRVQLVDNWGWCTGVCPGGEGGNQCFGAECSTSYPDPSSDETKAKTSNPWMYFSGYVVVEPSK